MCVCVFVCVCVCVCVCFFLCVCVFINSPAFSNRHIDDLFGQKKSVKSVSKRTQNRRSFPRNDRKKN